MSMSDPIADMLTRIRNGQRARLARVSCPASKYRRNILSVLKSEGYIRDYADATDDAGKPQIAIDLKYHDGEPVIKELKRLSKPGRRVYTSSNDMPKIHNGLGIAIISTPKGVLSDFEARNANVGGELICSVF